MEPTDLTCPRCGTAWKVIKAADGPVTCPHCKAVVESTAVSAPAPPSAQAPAAAPPAPPPVQPEAPPVAPAPLALIPTIPDSAERELRRDYEEPGGPPFPPRRRRHPLLVVLAVLLILFVLLPVAGIVLLFAVCAYSWKMSN